jgi:hypothetical protein
VQQHTMRESLRTASAVFWLHFVPLRRYLSQASGNIGNRFQRMWQDSLDMYMQSLARLAKCCFDMLW